MAAISFFHLSKLSGNLIVYDLIISTNYVVRFRGGGLRGGGNIYQQLFKTHCKAYPDKKKENNPKELKRLPAINTKKRGGLMQFFANSSTSNLNTKAAVKCP